ncbi:MAG: flagellar hook-associated protein FlgK [Planctomycetota bacterium]
MGLLNSALHIGRNAILGYQAAMEVIGNNVSSSASPDYTRLTPQLDPQQGLSLTRGLQPGAGVALTDIQRNIDEALESQLRLAVGSREAAFARQATIGQVEVLFDETSGSGLSSQIRDFLHAFDELQNSPEDPAIRDLVVARGATTAQSFRALRDNLANAGEAADSQIADVVAAANELVGELGGLNQQITRSEAGGAGLATGLRDQRDALLRDLGQLFDVTTHEQPNGALNIYIGSEALVQGSAIRTLVAVEQISDELARTAVRFVDNGAEISQPGGRLGGLMTSRDDLAYARLSDVDRLGNALIAEVNGLHADGQGAIGFQSVVSSNDVLSTGAPLDSVEAGLEFPPQRGGFYITVYDEATRTPRTQRIDVTLGVGASGTTLDSLVADINAQVTGVTADITADQRLRLTSADGSFFTFGFDGNQPRTDTSGVLAALGINTFFTGGSARDIAVNPVMESEPRLLAAAGAFLPGDGGNAGRIAALDTTSSEFLDGISLLGFQKNMAAGVALDASHANEEVDTTDSIVASLSAQREAVSGVNLDEEAISLLKFERAFQGAARFVSVVDDLLGELVALVR